ncbi:MAG: O-antigen ligase family protein [Planctomycetes bacterium]|nr:O-antigen ligase family protein [Planctomycetota bacterium]
MTQREVSADPLILPPTVSWPRVLGLSTVFLALHQLAAYDQQVLLRPLILGLAGLLLVQGLRDRHWLFVGSIFFLLVAAISPAPLVEEVRYARWACPIAWVLLELPRVARSRRAYRPFTRFHGLAGLFVAVSLLSATWSIAPVLTLGRAGSIAVAFFFVCFCLWRRAENPDHVRRMLSTVVTIHLAGAVAGVGLLVLDAPSALNGTRFQGIYGNPNEVGLCMALLLPLLLPWGAGSGAGGEAGAARGRQAQRRTAAAAALAAGALLFSGSRSSLLGVSLGMLLSGGRRARALGVVLFVSAGLYLVLEEKPEGFLETTVFRSSTLATGSDRLERWIAGWSAIEHRFALGHGFGTSDYVLPYYRMGGEGVTEERLMTVLGGHLHNTFLQLGADLGVIGGLIGLLLAGWTARTTFLARWRWRAGWETIGRQLQILLIMGISVAMFESWLFSFGNAEALLFWTYCVLALRGRTQATGPTAGDAAGSAAVQVVRPPSVAALAGLPR